MCGFRKAAVSVGVIMRLGGGLCHGVERRSIGLAEMFVCGVYRCCVGVFLRLIDAVIVACRKRENKGVRMLYRRRIIID